MSKSLRNRDVETILSACREIKAIASLETCSLGGSAGIADKNLKSISREELRYWAQWFDCYADTIIECINRKGETK